MNLTLFAFFNVVLSTLDLGSDTYQAYIYYKNGNINWGNATITIVFIPVATRCFSELLKYALKKNNEDKSLDCKGFFVTISEHIPIVQQIVHVLFLKSLKASKDKMEKSLSYYQTTRSQLDKSEEVTEEIKEDVNKAAEDYCKAEGKYLKLMTNFQRMKLYEAFGESAPQAGLQIGWFHLHSKDFKF